MVIDRLRAYAEAGADCLYAPGIRSKEQIAAVVKAVHPKPVNLLLGWPGLSVAEVAELGVRRISVGGALARAAWGGFMRAAREISEKGTFTELGTGEPAGQLNKMFG
jgi:2-methylisocitrate lyase-like PEP mutase family enzyme